MSERRTDDATLIAAVRIIARTIQSEDGVIPACLAEAANRLETLVDERRWIPVGERLPEQNKFVLVDGDEGYHVASYELLDSGSPWWTLEDMRGVPVTHWQQITPPEGE